jgi:hypothetical protein
MAVDGFTLYCTSMSRRWGSSTDHMWGFCGVFSDVGPQSFHTGPRRPTLGVFQLQDPTDSDESFVW